MQLRLVRHLGLLNIIPLLYLFTVIYMLITNKPFQAWIRFQPTSLKYHILPEATNIIKAIRYRGYLILFLRTKCLPKKVCD